MIDAGPGTATGRSNTLQSVGTKGPSAPVHSIHDRLQRWRFEMVRLSSLGGGAPDPSVQVNVAQHFVGKLAETDRAFDYRLNSYLMARYLRGGRDPGTRG